jgi:hypothetical protein
MVSRDVVMSMAMLSLPFPSRTFFIPKRAYRHTQSLSRFPFKGPVCCAGQPDCPHAAPYAQCHHDRVHADSQPAMVCTPKQLPLVRVYLVRNAASSGEASRKALAALRR